MIQHGAAFGAILQNDGELGGDHVGPQVIDTLGIGGLLGNAVYVPANTAGLIAVAEVYAFHGGELGRIGEVAQLVAQNFIRNLIVGLLMNDLTETLDGILGEIVPQQSGTSIGHFLQELVMVVGEDFCSEQALVKPLVGFLQSLDEVLALQAVLDSAVLLGEVALNDVGAAGGTIEGLVHIESVIGLGAPEGIYALAAKGGRSNFLHLQGILMQILKGLQLGRAGLLISISVYDPLIVTAGSALTGPVGYAIQAAIDLQHLTNAFGNVLLEGVPFVHVLLQILKQTGTGDLVQHRSAVQNDGLGQVVGRNHQVQLRVGVGVRSVPVDGDVELVAQVLGSLVLSECLVPAGVVVIHGEIIGLTAIRRAGGYIGIHRISRAGLIVVSRLAGGGAGSTALAAVIIAAAARENAGYQSDDHQQSQNSFFHLSDPPKLVSFSVFQRMDKKYLFQGLVP